MSVGVLGNRVQKSMPAISDEYQGIKLNFSSKLDVSAATSVFNSPPFYCQFIILSDCRHVNMSETKIF